MEETAGTKKRAPRSRERGKGLHNKGTQRVLFQVSCQPEERERIKQLAEESGKNVSAFIIEKILGKNS